MSRKRKDENESLTRIAIVNGDRCKPKKCRLECKRFCPVVRMGKLCIEVENTSSIAYISETLCNGCGICVKKCPYGAISIINLPSNLNSETTHRYGPNQFKLHRLPTPRPNQVLGLVGTNGIGKSTALKVLAGRLKPNLGKYNEPPDWSDILVNFRGSELQNYFTKVLEDNLKPVIKPQYVDQLPRAVRGIVGEVIDSKNESGKKDYYVDLLDLRNVLGNEVEKLSGGELQRFAICITSISNGDVFMFDEPSSYLDVKQRLNAARAIRSLIETTDTKFVICVEHDLSVLDYLSDFVCVLYGVPGAYGVVTLPFGVREGINIFLAGFVHTENLRFRETSLSFKVKDNTERDDKRSRSYSYPQMTKTVGHFQLDIDAGEFTDSEIIVLLGENGTGKTTFIRMLAGILKPDNDIELPELKISYKPQQISPKFKGSVENLLDKKLGNAWRDQQFKSDVVRPLGVEEFLDQEVNVLSGGEIQRVAIILALGKAADIYLIDEPSAYLDSEQRIICAKVIKRFILHSKKSAFIVEHDFIMATYLSDRVIVYEGQPSVKCTATSPRSLIDGMNRFLQLLDITFRRDRENFRPRINKYGSQKDREQKASGNYFISDD